MIKLRKDISLSMILNGFGQMFSFFCFALTSMVLISGALAWTSDYEWTLNTQDLYRLILVSLFAVLPMLINIFLAAGSIKGVYFLRIAQFILTTILVMGALILFREPNGVEARMYFVFFIIYIAIYLGVFVKFLIDVKLANKINKGLDAIQREDNATCSDENESYVD